MRCGSRAAWALTGLLAAVLVLAWASGALPLVLQMALLRLTGAPEGQPSLALDRYRVVIEAREVEGVADNLSGLTYHAGTRSLFATINRPPEVIELDSDGHVLRHIPILDTRDVEGITHLQDDWFALSDEDSGKIIAVQIHADTREIATAGAPFLRLDPLSFRNMGFEALSWDSQQKALYLGNEMWPVRVLKVEGLKLTTAAAPMQMNVTRWRPNHRLGPLVTDLSSLTVHDESGNILLLSHVSRALTEYDAEGTILGILRLWRGAHGLSASVPQAEGVAIGDDGAIFIVSEPNLFYRFEREGPELPGAPRPRPWPPADQTGRPASIQPASSCTACASTSSEG